MSFSPHACSTREELRKLAGQEKSGALEENLRQGQLLPQVGRMFSLMEDLAAVSPCTEVWLLALYEDFSIVFSNSIPDVTSPQEDVVGLVKHLLAAEELSKGAGLQIPILTNTDIFHFFVGCIYNIFIFIIIIL